MTQLKLGRALVTSLIAQNKASLLVSNVQEGGKMGTINHSINQIHSMHHCCRLEAPAMPPRIEYAPQTQKLNRIGPTTQELSAINRIESLPKIE